jgi:hypothetical protein
VPSLKKERIYNNLFEGRKENGMANFCVRHIFKFNCCALFLCSSSLLKGRPGSFCELFGRVIHHSTWNPRFN